MAAFSPAFMSSFEKKPKPDVDAGFGEPLVSGTVMLLQTGAPLPVAAEMDIFMSGWDPSGAAGSGLEVLGLVV